MQLSQEFFREKIIEAAQLFYEKGFLAATDGNFSYKLNEEEILITPSGRAKKSLQSKDILIMNQLGEAREGEVSSEKHLHLSVYKECSKARAVFHAHPPKAIALSLVCEGKLPSEYLSEVILATGDIPIVPYARPGTKDLGEQIKSFLPENKILVLAHHGALSWGESFEEALWGMERLEHSASIIFDGLLLGNPKKLSHEETQWLYEKRSEIGNKTL